MSNQLINSTLARGKGGKKPRLEYIDAIKGLAISLVIYGHTIQYMGVEDYDFWGNIMFKFIYSFHMPLFMVLSGFFFKSALKYSFVDLVTKKAKQLILPIVTWAIILAIPSLFVVDTSKEVIVGLINRVVQGGYLWFLKCVFVNYMIAYVLLKITKSHWIISFIIAFAFSQLVPIYSLKGYLIFFWMGIFLNHYYEFISRFTKYILIVASTISILIYTLWIVDFLSGNYIYEIIIQLPSIISKVSLEIISLISKITTCLAIILCFKQFYKPSYITNVFSVLGKQTLGIYILQNLLMVWVNSLFNLSVNGYIYTFIITPAATVIILIILNKIINVLNRYPKISNCII